MTELFPKSRALVAAAIKAATAEKPWRIYHDGRYSHTAYAETGNQAIARETERLGIKGPTTEIKAMLARSASD
jgi:hypothetical protein